MSLTDWESVETISPAPTRVETVSKHLRAPGSAVTLQNTHISRVTTAGISLQCATWHNVLVLCLSPFLLLSANLCFGPFCSCQSNVKGVFAICKLDCFSFSPIAGERRSLHGQT